MPDSFEHEEEEKFDEVAMQIAEKMMGTLDMTEAEILIQKLQNAKNKDEKNSLLDELQTKYPEKFEQAIQQCLQT